MPSRADYPKGLLNALTELCRKRSERSCTSFLRTNLFFPQSKEACMCFPVWIVHKYTIYMHSYAECKKKKADWFCSCQKSHDGNKICYVHALFTPMKSTEGQLSYVFCLFCLSSTSETRAASLISCAAVSFLIRFRCLLLCHFLWFFFLTRPIFLISLLALCLCVCLCFCMCVCTRVSLPSLTAKMAGCLQMP